MRPSADTIARFSADLAALDVAEGARLGLAVSGGPDSLAMLLLAQAAGLTIEAATVDHRLRPGSDVETRGVARVCRSLGVRHATLTITSERNGNLSAWARRERYRLLEAWADDHALDAIVTAHHADDQLETIVLRLNRASGVSGLAGIRARNGRIVRPLLGWRRSELRAVVEEAGIEPVDDPSNRDDRFDRARLRKALEGQQWLDPLAVARSAAAIADAEDALDWYARRIGLDHHGDTVRVSPAGLPRELLRRVVIQALRVIDPERDHRGEAVQRLIERLKQGKTTMLGMVACYSRDGCWTFTNAPPRRPTKPRRSPSRADPPDS